MTAPEANKLADIANNAAPAGAPVAGAAPAAAAGAVAAPPAAAKEEKAPPPVDHSKELAAAQLKLADMEKSHKELSEKYSATTGKLDVVIKALQPGGGPEAKSEDPVKTVERLTRGTFEATAEAMLAGAGAARAERAVKLIELDGLKIDERGRVSKESRELLQQRITELQASDAYLFKANKDNTTSTAVTPDKDAALPAAPGVANTSDKKPAAPQMSAEQARSLPIAEARKLSAVQNNRAG